MKNIVKTSKVLIEDEYEVIHLPETMVKQIDEAIEISKIYCDRDEFVSSAIHKFISTPLKEKTQIPQEKTKRAL
jgi:Arc/MetJ-type ribon-helix-helix transcriptional regulator